MEHLSLVIDSHQGSAQSGCFVEEIEQGNLLDWDARQVGHRLKCSLYEITRKLF